MTPRQKELARHALGLGNGQKKSYRNRFVAGPGHPDYNDWMIMMAASEAYRREAKTLPFGADDLFRLTTRGAMAVLEPGETLCREDFPEAA